MQRNALGRGLGALIREPEPQIPTAPGPASAFATTTGGAAAVPAREVAMGPLEIETDPEVP